MNPDQPKYAVTGGLSSDGENLVRALEKAKGRPLNVLSLSGGGQNGAFGAGFLIGWREAGTRPQFDAVGGVSTGALLATHALLGTPEDDAKLEEMYTQVTQEHIYKPRSVFALLKSDSLMDTTPLQEMIARYITEETLERVAKAFDEGRFIAVGTTNIDYEQTWIWNLSLIAKASDLELYRKVLLASASFPIVFPPVEINGHLFEFASMVSAVRRPHSRGAISASYWSVAARRRKR
jgi:predicted acylesterase/phospholipase RssA